MQAMVVKGSQEVGEDAEDDGCAAEFNDAKEPREAFECETAAECHGCLGGLMMI